MRYLPNIPAEKPAAEYDKDFLSSEEERGLPPQSTWRVMLVVVFVLCMVCVLFVSGG